MMSKFAPCMVKCCICGKEMDWFKRLGYAAACCSAKCCEEFDWRQTLAILGEKYRPKPQCQEKKNGEK